MGLKRQLQIRIYPDGTVEGKTLGVTGRKCTEYIAVLEQLLGAKAVHCAYTAEYDQPEMEQQTQTVAVDQDADGKVQP